MSPSSGSSRRRRDPAPARNREGRAIFVGILLIVAWGVLAFGSPYRWAYTSLAIGSLFVGAWAWIANRRVALASDQRWLLVALTIFGLGTVIQLVPLPASICDAISPSSPALLRYTSLGYAAQEAALEAGVAVARPSRPLSIAPDSTLVGLFLLSAFVVLLAGLLRYANRQGVSRLASAIVKLALAVALIGIVQKALLGDDPFGGMKIYGFWTPQQKLTTPFGPFVNKNHYAGWMIMALPVALGSFLAQVEEAMRKLRDDWRARLLWLSSPSGGRLQLSAFALVVMGVALTMTLSRSGIACFVAAIVAAAIVVARHQSSLGAKAAVVGALAALLATALLWSNVNVGQRFSGGADASFQVRRGIWSDTLHIVRDFPAVGTGLDTLATAMQAYQTVQLDMNVRESHNEYLQVAAEGGLLLGIPALAALFCLVVGVRRRFTAAEDDASTSWIRFGAATGLAAIGLQSLVEFSLQMPGNAALFVVLAAMALHRPARPAAIKSVVILR